MTKPIPYFGGKSRSCKILNNLIPYHKLYVEVFGGGASLLFYKQPSFIEIYNDLNYDMYNRANQIIIN